MDLDLHLKKYDRRKSALVGAAYALAAFGFSIYLSAFNGRTSLDTIAYTAMLCALLAGLVGALLGGHTTLYDRKKKGAVGLALDDHAVAGKEHRPDGGVEG